MEKINSKDFDIYLDYYNSIEIICDFDKIDKEIINVWDFTKIPIIKFINDKLMCINIEFIEKNILTDHFMNEDFYEKKIGYFLYCFLINFYKDNNKSKIFGGFIRNFFDPVNTKLTKYIDIDIVNCFSSLNIIDIIKNNYHNYNHYNDYKSYNYDIKIRKLYYLLFKKSIITKQFLIYPTILNDKNFSISYLILDTYTIKIDDNQLDYNWLYKYNLVDLVNNNNFNKLYNDFIQNGLLLDCKFNSDLKIKKTNYEFIIKCDYKNQSKTLNKIINNFIFNKLLAPKDKYLPDSILLIIESFLPENNNIYYLLKNMYLITKKIIIPNHNLCFISKCLDILSFNSYKIIERYIKFKNKNYKILSSVCKCRNCIYKGLNKYLLSNTILSLPIYIAEYYYNKSKIYNEYYHNILLNKCNQKEKKINYINNLDCDPSMFIDILDKSTIKNTCSLDDSIYSNGNQTQKQTRFNKKLSSFYFGKRLKKKSKSEYSKSLLKK